MDRDHGLDAEAFRRHGHALVDAIADYMVQVAADQCVVVPPTKPGQIIAMMPESAPQHGEPFENIAIPMFDLIKTHSLNWQSPRFFGYFPAQSTAESLLADLCVGAVSTPAFSWPCSPAATELEVVAMDWLCRMFGLSDDFLHASGKGGGVLQTSASDCAIVACIAARTRASALTALLNPNHQGKPQMVILGTTQTHSLGSKAGLILDLPFVAIETKAQNDCALTGPELEAALKLETANGRLPCCLIATLGSTSSGAIDRLAELTAVAKHWPHLYIHVDAAWAGVMLALPEVRDEAGLAAINTRGVPIRHPRTAAVIGTAGEVHSFTTNLHKQGLVYVRRWLKATPTRAGHLMLHASGCEAERC